MALFRKAFNKYPLISNCLVYGSLYTAAEFSQQTVLKKFLKEPGAPEQKYDTKVIKDYAIVSTCGMSPVMFFWYKWLDGRFLGTAKKIIVQKVLLDQFIMTPHLLAIFYVGCSLLEKKEDVFEELKQKFIPTYKVSCGYWIPMQAINFALIPAQFRVVYVGVCSFIWVNVLCSFKRS